MKGYELKKTKRDSWYISGKLCSGVDVFFKVWDNSAAFSKMKDCNYEGMAVYISASVDEYGGASSLLLSSIEAVEGFSEDMFLPTVYNIEAYWEGLQKLSAQHLTEKGQELAKILLFNTYEEVESRFKLEFAASSHHDNCKGGLLAHTYKVCRILSTIFVQYKSLFDSDHKDLVFIGGLMHDIGKIREYNMGIYQKPAYADHLLYGVEYLTKHKEDIVKLYSEDWYSQLLAIVLEHHGEYGMPCKTVDAYILHMADLLDSRITLIQQGVADVERGGSIKVDDKYLVY